MRSFFPALGSFLPHLCGVMLLAAASSAGAQTPVADDGARKATTATTTTTATENAEAAETANAAATTDPANADEAPTETTPTTPATPPPPTTPTSPATATPTTPAQTTPAPAPVPAAPSDPAGDTPPPATTTTPPEGTLATDTFSPCIALAKSGAPRDDVTACLAKAERLDPEGLNGVRATAALTMLEAIQTGEQGGVFGDPGRLELVGVAGVFGVWNAIAIGTTAAVTAEADPGFSFLGIAGLALVSGVGFGYGGYLLGEAAELDEGGAKLVSSGLVWGSNMGIAAATIAAENLQPETAGGSLAVVLLPVVAMGYVGGAVGFGAAKVGRFDAAQVSMVNSGGALGSFVGGMVAINMAERGVEGVTPYALTYMAGNAAGLVGFGILSNTLDLSWGETIIGDLGMVAGGTAGGLGMVGALLIIGGDSNTPFVALTTGASSLGAMGGYAAGVAAAIALRSRGVEAPATAFKLQFNTGAILDRTGALVSTMGLRFNL